MPISALKGTRNMKNHSPVHHNEHTRHFLSTHLNWTFILIVLFLTSTVIHGLAGDFPKALRIYPDELLYVSLGRSLLHGQGLQVHNLGSNFQKILYSLCTIPAFLFQLNNLGLIEPPFRFGMSHHSGAI